MRLSARINLLITTLILLIILVTGGIFINDRRDAISEEIEASDMITLQLMRTVAFSDQFIPSAESPLLLMRDFLQQLGHVRAHNILLYDLAGHRLYASPPPRYKWGRNAPQWFARLMTPAIKTTTMRVWGGRLVIQPDSSRAVLDAWDGLKYLIWLWLAFFVVLNLLVAWCVRRWLQPLQVIRSAIGHVRDGRFQFRLPGFNLPEMAAISQAFNRMAEALVHSMGEAQRLALIARQSSEGILITDQTGLISFWNQSAVGLFGYRDDEVLGRPLSLLRAEDAMEGEAESAGEHWPAEAVWRRRDGQSVQVLVSAAPFTDPDSGQVMGRIFTVRDMTEIKRAEATARQLQQNRELTQQLQLHVERERKHLARELHDELGQCVTAIRTIAASIGNRKEEHLAEIHQSAQAIQGIAGHVYDAMHGIIHNLRPPVLDSLDLGDALLEHIRTLQARHPTIRFELEAAAGLDVLGEEMNIAVYRIVQEGLTNIIRHAHAATARVRIRLVTPDLETAQGWLELVIEDDGCGIGEVKVPGHFGLRGIKERVEAMLGQIEIHTAPGTGTRLEISIPFVKVVEKI